MATRKSKAKPTEPSQVHLWTAADISHWRDRLSKEQQGIDPITQEPLVKPCLDHDHSKTSQRVRGTLSAATNAWEGRVLGCYHRYMKYSTDTPLSTLLKNLGEYYERNNDHMPLHTSWIKVVSTSFSSLPEPKKALVLKELGKENGQNSSARKKIMLDCIKSKKYSYNHLMELIHKHKGN